MKLLVVLSCLLCLVSCSHTAIAPVCTPEGTPAVVRIPKARYGKEVEPEALKSVLEAIGEPLKEPGSAAPEASAAGRGIAEVGLVGPYGDVKTKKGGRFVGFFPVVVIRSTLPPDQVDRAAGILAAACYRSAKKSFDVYPTSDLLDKPKPKPKP